MSTHPRPDHRPLPRGYASRRLVVADAARVTAVVAECERLDTGEALVEEEDVVADWQRPSFDLATSAVGVEHDGALVAYAEVYGARRAEAHVLPQHRGRGLGTWLAGWTQLTATRDGGAVVGQGVLAGSSADHLLTALGYDARWTTWVLQLPDDRRVEAQPLPTGYALRDLRHDGGDAGAADDARRAHRVVEDAFAEWPDRPATSYDDWAARSVRRPGFEPGHLRLVTEPSGDVVGACLRMVTGATTYVDQLAVRADRRGLGLARALLADAFTLGRAAGGTRPELSTDSRTGALGLYLRVGMTVRSTWVHRAVELPRTG